MDAGADGGPDWRGCHGRTLLGAAAYGKSEQLILALINAGHDVTVTFGATQKSALHVAAKRGAENACNAFMLAGANPNIVDISKQSPLCLAAEAGHDGVVSTLLVHGADPNAKIICQGQTPLHLAAVKGHALCVSKLLAGGAEKDSCDLNGCSPLHVAAQGNHVGAVEELLAAGANVDVRMKRWLGHFSALDMAAERGHVDVVRALLRHGSSILSSDEYGHTALHRAAFSPYYDRDNGEVVQILLQAGADIEAKATDIGFTPLHFAVSGRVGSNGTIRALLEGGADVNARVAEGGTPLHAACFESCVRAVELLLLWGADEKLTQKEGETAEDMIGEWERNAFRNDEERKADDQRIRRMLARAPADRSWRRRGWLVLARSRPAKVQLAHDNDIRSRSSDVDSSAKVRKIRCDGSGVGEGEDRAQAMVDTGNLVRRVVGLDTEGVFRLVVGFL